MNNSYLQALTELKVDLFSPFHKILLGLSSQFLRSMFFYPGNLQSFVRKGQLTKEDCEKKFSLLSGVLDYEQFRDADLVIEVDPISMFSFFLFMHYEIALLMQLCHLYQWWIQTKLICVQVQLVKCFSYHQQANI